MRALWVLVVLSLAACSTGGRPAAAAPAPAIAVDAGAPKPPRPLPFAQVAALPAAGATFEPVYFTSGQSVELQARDLEPLLASGAAIDLDRFFYAFYRYRDRATLPTHRRVAAGHRNFLQRLWSIALLGELGDRADFSLVSRLVADENPLVREVAANALGRLGTPGDVAALEALEKRESDDYVRATLEAAVRRLTRPRPPRLTRPVYEKKGRRRLAFFFNAGVTDGLHAERSSLEGSAASTADSFVFPHQQYRFGVKGAPPLPNFGGPIFHVGEDSGWFLQGVPVHAMANGVVCRVLYDLSWGTVVVVEHVLPQGERVTSYYAHLHHDVDVAAGDQVRRGQKLGEIGPATSLENGGYWPHLHTGIERARCAEARVAGYDPRLDRYADPLWFVLEHAPAE